MKHPLIKLTEYLNGISGNIRIWSGQDSASIVPFPFYRYRSLRLNVRRKTPLPRYFAAKTTRSFWGLCCVCYRICVHKKLLCFCSDSCRIVFLTMVKEFFIRKEQDVKNTREKEKEGKEGKGRTEKETKKRKKREEQSGKNKKSEKRTERRKKEAENRKRTKWKKHKFSSTTRPLPFFPVQKKTGRVLMPRPV